MSGDYEFEPVPGLPEPLPAGEIMLWQGAPDWKNIAKRALHIRGTAIYFALLLVWYATSKLGAGEDTNTALLSTLQMAGFAFVALALIVSFAYMSAKSTLYTVTSKRVVMRAGVALPMVLNLPFTKIESADLKTYPDGSGDIALTLPRKDRIAYLLLWPHVQPWRLARARPMLRGLPDAAVAAQILAQALAATLEGGAAQPATRKERIPATVSRPHAAAMA